ncbi:isopentenyl transferase family protein [Rhizobium nepotum]|uniref:isopentenyl transferase family protein n=1 Tax=Rhizobium nepotum TaxID=1035271 RepID=UPI003CF474BF
MACQRLRLGISDAFLPSQATRCGNVCHPGRSPLVVGGVGGTLELPCRSTDFGDIDGYRCAIRFARKHDLAISQLPNIDAGRHVELIEAIANEYLEHALSQERDFPPV